MSLLKNILNEFSPQNFAGKPYFWLMNQWGHITISAFLGYYLSLLTPYFYIVLIGLWLAWEIVQYKRSKDTSDLIQDLFFEISGVLIAFNFFTYLPIGLLIVLLIFVYKVKKKYE